MNYFAPDYGCLRRVRCLLHHVMSANVVPSRFKILDGSHRHSSTSGRNAQSELRNLKRSRGGGGPWTPLVSQPGLFDNVPGSRQAQQISISRFVSLVPPHSALLPSPANSAFFPVRLQPQSLSTTPGWTAQRVGADNESPRAPGVSDKI